MLNHSIGMGKSLLNAQIMATLHHWLAVINRAATADLTSVIDTLRHPTADVSSLNVSPAESATTHMAAAESAAPHVAATESATTHMAAAEPAPHVAATTHMSTTTMAAASTVIRINDRLADQ